MEPEKIEPSLITCPYNEGHKISMYDFNEHVWKCRSEKMKFYPHSLVLKRCSHNLRHFVPEEELPFHELFCKPQSDALKSVLRNDPVEIDVSDFMATQKARRALESDESDSDSDDDEEGVPKEKDHRKMLDSEIEESDVEPEDVAETAKRLVYQDIVKQLN